MKDHMVRRVRRALLAWMPGFCAGIMPLVAFILAHVFAGRVKFIPDTVGAKHFDLGLISHLLVLSMVTSAAGLASAIVQLWQAKLSNFVRDGYGPIGIFLLLILSMVSSTLMYGLFEIGVVDDSNFLGVIVNVLSALALALWMEFSIARLHVLSDVRNDMSAGGGLAANSVQVTFGETDGEC